MRLLGSITRRRLLQAASLAAAGNAANLPLPRLVFAQTLQPVKFTLPWVAEGSNMFTYVAKGMGLWEKHGLDVNIARGSGSIPAPASARRISRSKTLVRVSTCSMARAGSGAPNCAFPAR